MIALAMRKQNGEHKHKTCASGVKLGVRTDVVGVDPRHLAVPRRLREEGEEDEDGDGDGGGDGDATDDDGEKEKPQWV